jgi:hypothetical protein
MLHTQHMHMHVLHTLIPLLSRCVETLKCTERYGEVVTDSPCLAVAAAVEGLSVGRGGNWRWRVPRLLRTLPVFSTAKCISATPQCWEISCVHIIE